MSGLFCETTEQCERTVYTGQFKVIHLFWGALDKHSEGVGCSEQVLWVPRKRILKSSRSTVFINSLAQALVNSEKVTCKS